MDNRQELIAYNTEHLFQEILRCHTIDEDSDARDYAPKHLPRIRKLLESGVDFTAIKYNKTFVSLAASYGLWDIVVLITQQKNLPIDIHNNKYGFNLALSYAASHNAQHTCKALLKIGANQSSHTLNNRNCLHFTIRNQNISLLKIFLHYAKDYDLQYKDGKDRTPLSHAAYNKCWNMCFVIVNHSKYTSEFDRILLLAVQHKKYGLVDLLLQKGADQTWYIPGKKDKTRNFPLHIAAKNNDVKSLKLLIQYNGDTDQTNGKTDDTGLTAYQIACKKNHGECAKFLLNHKTIQFNHSSRITFQKAIKKKKFDVADAIVRATSGPNHLSEKDDGNTVLHNIMTNWMHLGIHAEPMFIYALKYGAKLTKKNHLNETPMELGSKLKRWDAIKLCLDITQKLKPEKMHCEKTLQEAVKNEHVKITSLLLERGTPCNDYNLQMGNIALCLAANSKNSKILGLLLEYGANPGMENEYGMTTYDLIREIGDKNCLDTLTLYQHKLENLQIDSSSRAARDSLQPSKMGLFSINKKKNELVSSPAIKQNPSCDRY